MKIFVISLLFIALTASSASGLFLKKKLLLKSLLPGGLDGHFGGYPGSGGVQPFGPQPIYPSVVAYPSAPAYPSPSAYPAPPVYPSPPVYPATSFAPSSAYIPPPQNSIAAPAVSYGPPQTPAAPAGVQGSFVYSLSSVPAQAPAVTYAVAPVSSPPAAPAVTYTLASSPVQATGVTYGISSQPAYGILLDSNSPSSGGYAPYYSKC